MFYLKDEGEREVERKTTHVYQITCPVRDTIWLYGTEKTVAPEGHTLSRTQ